MDADAVLAGLDPEQEQAARAVRGPVCILAGAGTGKTRTITHRIAYAIQSGAVPAAQLLAVTFTARAAGELRSRLRALGVGGVQARTFHAAALRQLRYFAPRVLGAALPALVENKLGLVAQAAARAGVREADRTLLRDLAGEVEWAKVTLVGPDGYAERVAGAGRAVPVDAATLAAVFAGYEEAKARAGLLDFEDLLLITAAAIEQHPDVAEQIRARYRHFVVDEYQDVSPLQQRLLDAWLGGRHDVCVVGDPSQTIYSFTGATAAYLLDFPRHHPGAVLVRLHRDYRSTPQVVGLANRVLGRRALLRLVGQRPPGPQPEFAEYDDEPAEAAAVAARCRELIDAGTPASEIAVLFRTNAQSETYEQALAGDGVPYLLRGGERFFARSEIREATVLLRGAARATQPPALDPQAVPAARAGAPPAGPEHGGAPPAASGEHGALPAVSAVYGGAPPAAPGEQAGGQPAGPGRGGGAPPAVPGEQAGGQPAVPGDRSGARPASGLPAAVRDVLSGLGWSPAAPPGGGALRARWESLAALVGLAEELAATVPGAGLSDLVAELEQRAAAQHAPTVQGVTLASLHAAKGLEWDVVFLVGLVEGTLPSQHATTDQQVDEERRLLYVGVTRARERIALSWSLSRAPGGRRSRRRSRFLYGIAPDLEPAAGSGPGQTAATRPGSGSPEGPGDPTARPSRARAEAAHAAGEPPDPDLVDRLQRWRTARADGQRVPAFAVLTDATLGAIAARRPADVRELVAIPGIGARKLDLYGADVLAIVRGEQPGEPTDRAR